MSQEPGIAIKISNIKSIGEGDRDEWTYI